MSNFSASLPRHPIGVVTRRTGLKPDLIRAWERRYGVVAPGRSETRRRLYSDADVERLKLLAALVDQGRRIGGLVDLDSDSLAALLREEQAATVAAPAPIFRRAEDFLEPCLAAVRELDGGTLEALLTRASMELSRVHLLEELLVPLLRRIGEEWHGGTLRPSHEHLASAAVRSFLGSLQGATTTAAAPTLVVTTPVGQLHEFGALLAAATARSEGWQVLYLGPNLPAEEIAMAVHSRQARALALSITYPPDDPDLAAELHRLGRLVSPALAILVGGQGRHGYGAVLGEIGACDLPDLRTLRQSLGELRRLPASKPR
ncbi:MAG: MerR family transcriptional regulator [Thermoanaerobaculia bacterium]|nr:MerR family transcriptional regulator [Thermoanaerobaculia bacterium]